MRRRGNLESGLPVRPNCRFIPFVYSKNDLVDISMPFQPDGTFLDGF
jgi:hypothetical protein